MTTDAEQRAMDDANRSSAIAEMKEGRTRARRAEDQRPRKKTRAELATELAQEKISEIEEENLSVEINTMLLAEEMGIAEDVPLGEAMEIFVEKDRKNAIAEMKLARAPVDQRNGNE